MLTLDFLAFSTKGSGTTKRQGSVRLFFYPARTAVFAVFRKDERTLKTMTRQSVVHLRLHAIAMYAGQVGTLLPQAT